MLKARYTRDNGQPVVVLGLSDMNLKKLRQGLPILFDNRELHLSGRTLMIYGRTQKRLLKELKPLYEGPPELTRDLTVLALTEEALHGLEAGHYQQSPASIGGQKCVVVMIGGGTEEDLARRIEAEPPTIH